MSIRVTVWNEYRHEKESEEIAAVYPNGIHAAIAEGLKASGGFEVGTATLDEPEHGLTDEVLAKTDVLVWWGHKAHGAVSDEIVDPGAEACARWHGDGRAPFRPYVEDLHALDGHELRSEVA